MPFTVSIVIGGIVRQILNVDGVLIRCVDSVKAILRSENGQFTQGFVPASMLFIIGSMAIIGPLDEGLPGDSSVLATPLKTPSQPCPWCGGMSRRVSHAGHGGPYHHFRLLPA